MQTALPTGRRPGHGSAQGENVHQAAGQVGGSPVLGLRRGEPAPLPSLPREAAAPGSAPQGAQGHWLTAQSQQFRTLHPEPGPFLRGTLPSGPGPWPHPPHPRVPYPRNPTPWAPPPALPQGTLLCRISRAGLCGVPAAWQDHTGVQGQGTHHCGHQLCLGVAPHRRAGEDQ